MRLITKILIWLKRIRYRRGYGVHSPFAFDFITDIIYQKGVYYSYEEIDKLPSKKIESDKITKLLFRLVNFQQPNTLYYHTEGEDISLVFKWAKSNVQVVNESQKTDFIDLVYISTQPNKPNNVIKIIDNIQESLAKDAMLVVYGIGYTKSMKQQWQQLISLPQAGISFDLYDVGILFFNQDKTKQDYIVNF